MYPEINAARRQPLSADQRRRNKEQVCIESAKRNFSLGLIIPRLHKGS